MTDIVAQDMLDGICESVRSALLQGETKVNVTLMREIQREGRPGVTDVEFVTVHGFKCADVERCGEPVHVFVSAMSQRYEYPHHLAHRETDGGG